MSIAAALAVALPAAAEDCRQHGTAVGPEPVLEAIERAREFGAASAAASDPPKTDGAPSAAEDGKGGWDVTGTFGPTRTISFSTREGTWMSVDVHPAGELLVFDLLGDLYTLPRAGGSATRITDGAAFDFQPRFSPDGKRLLFASDRGGAFNLWVADFADGKLGTPRALTEEKKQLTDGASWDPSGEWIYVRKRLTDVSSIGVSSLWAYHVDGGAGFAVLGSGQAGEVDSASATRDGRWIYLATRPPFAYNQDPYGSIWSIQRFDRRRGELEPVNVGLGSSAVPVLSPDETTLAFVRRVDGKTTLWLHDLASGAERQVWDGLDRDQLETFATHGVYPGFDWAPDGRSLVVWAQGGLHEVFPFADPADVRPIPFEAQVEQRVHEPLRQPRPAKADEVEARIVRWPVQAPDGTALVFQALGRLYRMDLPDGEPQRLTDGGDFELSPAFAPDGRSLVYATWNDDRGGALVRMDWPGGRPREIHRSGSQIANPAFSPDGSSLVFVQGSGANLRGQELGSELRHDLHVVPGNGGAARFVASTANRGSNRRIPRPTFGPDGERIYFFEDLPGTGGAERGSRTPDKTGLTSVALDGTDRRVHLRFRYAQEAIPNPGLTHVAFTELHNAFVIPMPGVGKTLDVEPGSLVPVAQLSWDGGEWVGWADGGETVTWSFGPRFHRARLDGLKFAAQPAPRPAEAAEPIEVEVTRKGGYRLDGATLDLDRLGAAVLRMRSSDPARRVAVTVAESAPYGAWKKLEDWLGGHAVGFDVEEAGAEEPPAAEAASSGEKPEPETFDVTLRVPAAVPEGRVALVGARIVTMKGDEVIEDGTIVVEGDRIVRVGPRASVAVPRDARVVDVAGKTIIPGLIDVHAHMGYGVLDVNPQREWRYYANLAYGVTATHDPSASTHAVFAQREMVEAGRMVGPRIWSTGFILYGATNTDMAPIESYADALSHVRRLKSLGAFSVKSYMQPRRDQRQWVLKAAREEGLLVFPEGGGDFEGNLTMILDGHSGIEHALSVGPIYDDVIQLFARSQVGYTPTLLVSYGGQFGENWFYQHHDVWRDERLQSYFPPRSIDARARRRSMSPEDDYNHKTVAAGCREILRAGGLINLGAHGQLQGLGAHWEMWALTHGGMTPREALRVATIHGARYLGMDADLGSIEPGKLADLVVLERDPLQAIENSDSVAYTMAGGVLYDAATMDRVWPGEERRGRFYFEADVLQNPLLAERWDTPFGVPPFDRIRAEHYLPAFHRGMEAQRAEIDAITANPAAPTFENTVVALEVSGALLERVSAAFFPRSSAHTDDALQAVRREVAPLLSAHATDIGFDERLFERVHAVWERREQLGLDPEQRHLLDETHKGFVRAGINRPPEVRARIREINTELSELSTKFGDNLLAETNAFELVVEDEAVLGALPPSLVAAAAQEAMRRGHEDGKHVFTLQRPSVEPFLQYAGDRELRRRIFEGYAARGDRDNEQDNKAVLARIAELRAERAALLGYPSHAHYELEDRMAEHPDRVRTFLDQVWPAALEVARREAADLEALMHAQGVAGPLAGHDWRYYTEQVRKERYDLDEAELRPYFEVNATRDGAFLVIGKLFGLRFEPRTGVPVWHPDQQVFEVLDADGRHVGVLYMDFFARPSKRAGAWENELRQQSNVGGRFVTPVVTTNFNFPAPTATTPSLLSWDEANTLLHELGHAIHDLLSNVTYRSLSGTNVPRDYVEFPSQLLENWLREPAVLKLFARHHETGQPIPDELIAKIHASRTFNQGFETVEYVAASYLDLSWHSLDRESAKVGDVRRFEDEALRRIGLIEQILPRYRSTYFSHVFSGGYSAGYYSYLWSEVLDADAFQAFKESGLFDPETAARLKRLLSRGGSRPGMELYREFRGRDPEIRPLLERRGLVAG